jgi:tetratricopeptide (TPR) repeat protein
MSADSTISPEKREQLQQLFVRGNEQMSKKNYEYADNIYFTQCVLQDSGNPIYAQTFLANLKKKFGEKKKTTRSLIALGKTMTVDAKKPESVFKVGIEALKSNPWEIETLISTGRACEDLGHLKSAIVYYQSAVDADPRHVGANRAYCEALRESADYDGALACLQRILKQNPEDRDTRQRLHDLSAEKAIHQGKYAAGVSRDTLESVSIAIPENEDAMGRTLTVAEQIERRIAKNPQDTANYVELAQWYSKLSDLAKAEECYIRAAEVSNNAPEMVERLLETQKKRLHAETLRLKEEYERHPQEDLKAIFFATRKQYEAKSLELAQFRIKHYPNYAGYRYDYGLLLQKSEQVKEAIAEFQLAKAEATLAGVSLLALGQCFQMIRQYKLAMTHYQEAVSTLEPGENKKKALYLAMKLSLTLEDYTQAEKYGHQLAAIDFSYRDLGDMLDQIAQKQHSNRIQ